MLHKLIPLADRHAAHSYEYANAGARTGATGFVAADVGKLALQTDTNALWILTATTPTWVAVAGSGSGDVVGPASAVDSQIAVFDTTTGKLLKDGGKTVAQLGALAVANAWTAQQTFKELKDTVHTITDGAAFEIDPANGSVQVVTLGAARTPAATNFEAGQTILLGIDDGTAYAITWTSVAPTWVKPGGTATAPTLATTGYTWVLLWKVGTTIYGAEVGKP